MEWKITDIHAKDGQIVSAKYLVSHTEGNLTIDTEGYWHFSDCGSIPFDQITEQTVIDWIQKESKIDGKSSIEQGVINQFNQPEKVIAPWLPQTFKVPV